MLKLIRRSTFETNSSSCHSVVLLAKDLDYTPDTNTTEIEILVQDYGWGYELIDDISHKLGYLMLGATDRSEWRKKFIEKLEAYYPNLNSVYFHTKEYDYDDFKRKYLEGEFSETLDEFFIDHASYYVPLNVLDNWSLAEYLHPKTQLHVANDNSDHNPILPKSWLEELGIDEDLAKEVADLYDRGYGSTQPYELNGDLAETIERFGGRVARS